MSVKEQIGCAGILFRVVIAIPLWLVLMFGILSHIDAPAWLWGCFWGYAPATWVGSIIYGIALSVKDGES